MSHSFSWMVRLLLSSLAGIDEDFNGEVLVLTPGFLGTGRRCSRPRPSGSGGGRGAALVWGVGGLLEIGGGAGPTGGIGSVTGQGFEVPSSQSQGHDGYPRD